MKRCVKKIALICLVLTLFVNCLAPLGYAQTIDNVDKLLIKNGVSELAVSMLSADRKAEMLEEIENGTIESISSSSNITTFDELAEIEVIVNNSAEKLGMEQDKYKKAVDKIEALAEMSDGEIAEKYGKSPQWIKMFRLAVTPSQEESVEKSGTFVSTSGYISASTLELSMNIYAYSPEDCDGKAHTYMISVYHDWLVMPFLVLEDQVAVAWGGGFTIMRGTVTSVFYRCSGSYAGSGIDPATTWESADIDWSWEKKGTNAGIVFYNNVTMADGWGTRGLQSFVIYKNNHVGEDADIIAQYAHQTISLDPGIGFSIGSGASVSISCSKGFSTSAPIDDYTIAY